MSVMDDYEDAVGMQIPHLILDHRPLMDVLADIDVLEAEATAHLLANGEAENLVELRRNLCGLRLSKTYELKGSVELATELISRYYTIGFENLERKITLAVIFARHCWVQGQPLAAVDRLESALAEAPSELYLVERQLLAKLRAAQKKNADS